MNAAGRGGRASDPAGPVGTAPGPGRLPATRQGGVLRNQTVMRTVVVLALALPLVGLVLLLPSDLAGPHWESPGLHFFFFLLVGATTASLSLVAGKAARRRGDARVFLLSLGFLATSGFMALHAAGTQGVLTHESLPGLTVAITTGLLVGAPFALASALVDLSPEACVAVMRIRRWLYAAVLGPLLVWTVWAVGNWPPMDVLTGEGGGGDALQAVAALGAVAYAAAAVRLLWVYRRNHPLLVISVIACYTLLAEALVGVAVAGERSWHPSWWVWHLLVVAGYLLVFGAARREWTEDRFHKLYLPATKEHRQEVSVLVGDLEGFTSFSDSRDAVEVAAMLRAYYSVTAPLITRRFGGEVEKFAGDGVFATFNRSGDQPDHALLAVEAAAALQAAVATIRREHPDWPGLRVGVNSGPVVVSEMGGRGYVAYPAVGDPVNVAARLQAAAPVGGVLVGERTRARLPDDVSVVQMPNLHLKGKGVPVDAYLVELPMRHAVAPRRSRS